MATFYLLLVGLLLLAGESDLEIVGIGEVDVAPCRELRREEVGEAEVVRGKTVSEVEDLLNVPGNSKGSLIADGLNPSWPKGREECRKPFCPPVEW